MRRSRVPRPYPANLADVCKRRRFYGPTPCLWPECECTGSCADKPNHRPVVIVFTAGLLSVAILAALLWFAP